MRQVQEMAAELAAEMEKQGKFTALYYSLNDGKGFSPVIAATETVEVLRNIEGDVDMAIEKINLHQLQILASM